MLREGKHAGVNSAGRWERNDWRCPRSLFLYTVVSSLWRTVCPLCHAVLRGLSGKRVCVSPRRWGKEARWCKFGVSLGSGMIGGAHHCLAHRVATPLRKSVPLGGQRAGVNSVCSNGCI